MAFILNESLEIVSFADYQDVFDTDARVFLENEGLTDAIIEGFTTRSTERILAQLKGTNWYKSLAFSHGASVLTMPDLNANYIKSRQSDFTDLCVYYTLSNYVLPKVADFGSDTNAEVVKISFYNEKYNSLFVELTANADWYDYDGNGTVADNEVAYSPVNYKRVR